VDLCSGIEATAAQKDLSKMRTFMRELKSAEVI
jgi:phosphoribosylanthranilate isomerase